jgi:hypothetical protein
MYQKGLNLNKTHYGMQPDVIGKPRVGLPYNDSKYFLYMPIKMAGDNRIHVPDDFSAFSEIISMAVNAEFRRKACLENLYIYVSIETSPLKAGIYQKRPGWHADGFLTDDVNYIWYDQLPTEFCIQKFDITQDHSISMEQFADQAREENIVTYPAFHLIRMTQHNVHRAALPTENRHSRTFIKISFSEHKYNLKGNTINPFFNYNWKMYDREEVRNCPIKKESDFVRES